MNVFLIPVLDRWLLHAPLHGVTALIDDRAAEALRSGPVPASSDELARLRDLLASPIDPTGELVGDLCPSFLGIIPTRGCNIGCVYCSFGGPTAAMTHMDPRIAVTAVDWMAERLQRAGRSTFQIHFFGGEPFASPDIVEVVVHRARYVSALRGLTPYIDASTNGVFNESRCRFVGDFFDGVVLSFDGFPEFHNRNRPAVGGRPTFEAVERTARRLSELPVDLCLRVCVTADSVSAMEEITAWMCASFKPAAINFETLTPGPLATRAGLKVPDPYAFARHYMGADRVASDAGIRVVYSAAETERARLSFCPVGTDALIVSMDGRISACYLLPEDWRGRGLDLDLGSFRADGTADIDFEALTAARRLPVRKPRCERCFCQWSCAGGCHVNQTYPGCTTEYTDFCIQTRVTTACLLLREIGCDDVVDDLLADPRAMERLSRHGFDPVTIRTDETRPVRLTPPTRERLRGPGSLVAEGMTLLG